MAAFSRFSKAESCARFMVVVVCSAWVVGGSLVECERVLWGQHSFVEFCVRRGLINLLSPQLVRAQNVSDGGYTHDTKLFHLTAPHLHIVDVGVSVVGTSVALGGVRVIAVVAVIVTRDQ